ncbi:MAG TPA: GAF domain-containing SpoIIE family protein phosphatase [Oceanobacillus sp.]|nr:GAF domain-containing SpoIIE family protein phosphatase [Oceanobacillus sp.]
MTSHRNIPGYVMGQSNLNQISAEHLLTLYEITRTFSSSLDFDEVLNLVIDSIMEVMRAQRGFLMVADGDTLQVKVARGMDGEQLTSDHAYSTTIVRQVVETRQSLLTNNAQSDTRYVPGQSIILAGLRAILCAPMLVQDRLIGVVYVDTAMRSGNFTDADLQLLNAVAGQAGVAIENARLYKVAVEKGRLDRELQMAREIQESLLPRRMPALPGYEVAARWRSAREVAGDFYDLFMLEDDALSLVIADVSDKGAPAALFMASARSMIRSHAFAGLSPVDVLRRTNDLILEDADSGMFVTVYYSLLRRDGYSIHANAGHNPPMLYRHADREVHLMPRGGRAIGWFPDNPIQAVELQLRPGDVIVYYTDGLTDAENQAGEPFGEERLAKALREAATRSADAILQHLVAQVDAFSKGTPAFDDLTLCVVRFTGDA